MDIAIFIIVGLYILRVILAHIQTWYYFTHYDSSIPPDIFTPDVSIIKPVCGREDNDYENFKSFCEQRYSSNFEILFCVEDSTDPVIPVIKELITQYPDKDIRLIHSGPYNQAKGKMKNMLTGFKESKYGIIIFTDSDIYVPQSFLQEAVKPVQDKNTGLAFSLPIAGGAENWVAGLLNLVMNDSIINYIPSYTLNSLKRANGAVMVIRKEVIEEIGGLEQFGDSIADDIELSTTLCNKGYRLCILDQPARIIHRFDTVAKCLAQIQRWLVIIRHYVPSAILFYGIFDIPLFWCLLHILHSLFVAGSFFTGLFLSALTLIVQLLSKIVINHRFARDKHFWKYIWLFILLDFIKLPLLIRSYLSRKVVWQGRKISIGKNGKITYE